MASVFCCCAAVLCPAGSAVGPVPTGCPALPGFAGQVSATTQEPWYYDSTLEPVLCPAGSEGDGVPTGCSALPGYRGKVVPTTTGPFYYFSNLTAVPCPVGSAPATGRPTHATIALDCIAPHPLHQSAANATTTNPAGTVYLHHTALRNAAVGCCSPQFVRLLAPNRGALYRPLLKATAGLHTTSACCSQLQ